MQGVESSQKQRSLIAVLPEAIGKDVFVKGWIHNIRVVGNNLAFVILRDRSGKAQIVVSDKATVKELKTLQPGTTIYVSAKVTKTDKTDQGVELTKPSIEIVNKVTDAWPVEINKPDIKANLDTILDNRALTLRHDKLSSVFKMQGVMAQAYREYMVENGFTEFFGPSIIASSSEGGAEIFKLDYFGKEATLAQSNQLYKQIMVGVYERVFGMAKWFRAENSNTRRHLTEGMQYEFEMGFIDGIEDIFVHIEGVIRYMIGAVADNCEYEVGLSGVDLAKLPEGKFPVYRFGDAIRIVTERTGVDTTDWNDLDPESERELCEYAREKYGSDFIIITHYPKGVFYAYKDEDGVYHNYDVLCREAEIISGGRRVDDYDQLVAAIKTAGMDPAAFSEYLSIFKFGMPPHGGFGLGFERFTMLALGLENIREASAFPSDPKRVASQHLPDVQVRGAELIKKEIKQLFVDNGLEFQVLKHEPTPTSEDSAKVRGLDLGTGVKALILRNKKGGQNVMVAIPADKRMDIKGFQAVYQEQYPGAKLEFEKPDTIQDRYGLEVGGVPPIGQVFGIETYIDEGIFEQETAAFNNADQKESIICKSQDLGRILVGKRGEFTS